MIPIWLQHEVRVWRKTQKDMEYLQIFQTILPCPWWLQWGGGHSVETYFISATKNMARGRGNLKILLTNTALGGSKKHEKWHLN